MIFGHDETRRQLAKLGDLGALPHALMLIGPNGCGKSLVAKETATRILCSSPTVGNPLPCGECKSCLQIESNNSPNLIYIDSNISDQSNVAAIRSLLKELYLHPFQGDRRVIIIDHAESLPLQSANVLLKAVEEPPKGTFFILITSSLNRIPETLASRCHRFHCGRLSEAELREIFAKKGEELLGPAFDTSRIDDLIMLADGSLESLSERSSDPFLTETFKKLTLDIARGSARASYELSDIIMEDKDTIRGKLHLTRLVARALMIENTEIALRRSLATMLWNITLLERFIFDRRLNANYLIPFTLLKASEALNGSELYDESDSLESLIN